MQHFRILESRIFLKKSHTCKQGGAHLRISFWHLFMNFEKLEKSEFWENEKKKKKKMLEISFYTCVPKTTIIWGTLPGIWSEANFFLSFWAIFCPLLPHFPNNPENQNFEKMKKASRDLTLHFLPFDPPVNPKNQNFEKIKKNNWRYYHFTLLYHKWRSYDVWFLRYQVPQTNFLSF